MRFMQAGLIFALYGWASVSLEAGWIKGDGKLGLIPVAVSQLGVFPTVTLLFFTGALIASWIMLRR